MTSEKAITARIVRELRARGHYVVKQHGTAYGRAGVPDLLACIHGEFVAIEVKRPGRRPTPIQDHNLRAIATAGGIAIVATSWEDAQKDLGPLLVPHYP